MARCLCHETPVSGEIISPRIKSNVSVSYLYTEYQQPDQHRQTLAKHANSQSTRQSEYASRADLPHGFCVQASAFDDRRLCVGLVLLEFLACCGGEGAGVAA